TVTLGSVVLVLLVAAAAAWKLPRWRAYLPISCALAVAVLGFVYADVAPDDRRVLASSASLTLLEVGIVAAVATLFSAFSSPFLTAMFTFSVFIVGRSADTLAKLPVKMFGEPIVKTGEFLSHVVPNLMFYVPPRPLLTGEAATGSLSQHLLLAAGQSVAWVVGLLALAALVFRRRDFL
ncbi:MAG TPA: hypothetical protein VFU02_17345, partial [Polyangiaceae bacterium]|nr:hypothetical protein [Polyangiaceae bacterium]